MKILNQEQYVGYISKCYQIEPIIKKSRGEEVAIQVVRGDVGWKFSEECIHEYNQEEMQSAYQDLLRVNIGNQEQIMSYINKYGLLVSDSFYAFEREWENHLKKYFPSAKAKVTLSKESFQDVIQYDTLIGNIRIFQLVNQLKAKIDSAPVELGTVLSILLELMMNYREDYFYPEAMRMMRSETYEYNYSIPSTYYIKYYFQRWIDFSAKELSAEELMKKLILGQAPDDTMLSHGCISTNEVIEIDGYCNTEQTSRLIGVTLFFIECARKKSISLKELNFDTNHSFDAFSINRFLMEFDLTEETVLVLCRELISDIIQEALLMVRANYKYDRKAIRYEWRFHSLSQALYYQMYIKLGGDFAECPYCQTVFYQDSGQRKIYCSSYCQKNAKRQRSYEKRKK